MLTEQEWYEIFTIDIDLCQNKDALKRWSQLFGPDVKRFLSEEKRAELRKHYERRIKELGE